MTQGGPVQGGGYIDHVHSLPTHIKDLVMQHGVPALNNAMYSYAYPQSNDLREAALMKNMTEPNWASSMFGAGAEDEYGFIDGGNWPSNRRAPSGIGPKGPGEAGGYRRPHMSEKEQKAKMDREKLRGSICGHTITGWMGGDSAQKCGGLDTCDKVAADSYKTGMNNYEAKARGEIDEMRDAQHHSLSQNLADARAQNQLNLARAQSDLVWNYTAEALGRKCVDNPWWESEAFVEALAEADEFALPAVLDGKREKNTSGNI